MVHSTVTGRLPWILYRSGRVLAVPKSYTFQLSMSSFPPTSQSYPFQRWLPKCLVSYRCVERTVRDVVVMIPYLKQDSEMSKVWYKQDDTFSLPKACLRFLLYT